MGRKKTDFIWSKTKDLEGEYFANSVKQSNCLHGILPKYCENQRFHLLADKGTSKPQ
jgi:hypothetical protein